MVEYDLELERVKSEIRKLDAKKVLIQLPAGLRTRSEEIYKELRSDDIEIFFWLGTCFGACDTPDVKGFDMVVQFGHSEWS